MKLKKKNNNLQIFAAFLCDNIREDSPGKKRKKRQNIINMS